jgi:hypothetical protein
MRLLRRLFVHNLGLKVLALAISFSLWATYTAEPFADVGYDVVLAFVNVPAGLALTGDAPNAVHVRLRGRTGLLRRLTAADLNFTVNLAAAHAGTIPVQLTTGMVNTPYGTEVVLITPSQFRVTLVTSATPVAEPE